MDRRAFLKAIGSAAGSLPFLPLGPAPAKLAAEIAAGERWDVGPYIYAPGPREGCEVTIGPGGDYADFATWETSTNVDMTRTEGHGIPG